MIFLWVVKVLVGMIMCGVCMPTHGMSLPPTKTIAQKKLMLRAQPCEVELLRKVLLRKKLLKEHQEQWCSIFSPGCNKQFAMKTFFEKYSVNPNEVIEGGERGYALTLLSDVCRRHFTFAGDCVDCAEYLLSRGADPNEQCIDACSDGDAQFFFVASPLETVARIKTVYGKQRQVLFAQTLLNHGANVAGSIAVELARENGNEDLAVVLERAYEEQQAKLRELVSVFMKNNERHKDCLVTCVNS